MCFALLYLDRKYNLQGQERNCLFFCQGCLFRIKPWIKVRVRISRRQPKGLICEERACSVCVCVELCSYALHMYGCSCNSTVGTAGLQLGRVFRAHDQTAARSANTSQDRSHHRASVRTSAPPGALKTLPAPLHASSAVGERERNCEALEGCINSVTHSVLP